MIKKIITKYFVIFVSVCIFMQTSILPSYAAYGIGCDGTNLGPLAKIVCGGGVNPRNETAKQLNNVISTVIGVLTIVAALWFIFQFLTAGYLWINSGGDKHNLEIARDRIINNIIGLVIVVASWTIIGLVGKVLGLDILNPGKVLLELAK